MLPEIRYKVQLVSDCSDMSFEFKYINSFGYAYFWILIQIYQHDKVA